LDFKKKIFLKNSTDGLILREFCPDEQTVASCKDVGRV